MNHRIGFLLALPLSNESATTVPRLAQAALDAGHEAYLYLIDEDVKNMHSQPFLYWAHSDVRVFVYGYQQYDVSTAGVDFKLSPCSLVGDSMTPKFIHKED